MQIDTTIEQAMTLSETIAENVLDWRTNEEAMRATKKLLALLYGQRALLEENGNVVPLKA